MLTKQLSKKTKHENCCLLFTISYPLTHLLSPVLAVSGTQRREIIACDLSPMDKRMSSGQRTEWAVHRQFKN